MFYSGSREYYQELFDNIWNNVFFGTNPGIIICSSLNLLELGNIIWNCEKVDDKAKLYKNVI